MPKCQFRSPSFKRSSGWRNSPTLPGRLKSWASRRRGYVTDSGAVRAFRISLVDIVKRRPILTRAGRFLAERASCVIDSVSALERDMRHFISGEAQPLVIGATVTVGNYILAPLLAQFEQRQSHGDIDVRVDNPVQLAALLRARRQRRSRVGPAQR